MKHGSTHSRNGTMKIKLTCLLAHFSSIVKLFLDVRITAQLHSETIVTTSSVQWNK